MLFLLPLVHVTEKDRLRQPVKAELRAQEVTRELENTTRVFELHMEELCGSKKRYLSEIRNQPRGHNSDTWRQRLPF
ncbi:hypothetical protein HAX54_000841 [Datura stramonium]|uniref:Uncharacterized protein n=1 Tax=Datura stramonium TaxID=4076 RepID=A0ABS8RS19_DATST|nr:hypothetical protein [Datura stramonium]